MTLRERSLAVIYYIFYFGTQLVLWGVTIGVVFYLTLKGLTFVEADFAKTLGEFLSRVDAARYLECPQ